MAHFKSSRDLVVEARGTQEVINQALTDLVSGQMGLPFQSDRVLHENGMVNVYIDATGRDVDMHKIVLTATSIDPHARPVHQTEGTIRIDFEEQRILAYAKKTGALVPAFRLTQNLVVYLLLFLVLCFLIYDKLVPLLVQRGTFDPLIAYLNHKN